MKIRRLIPGEEAVWTRTVTAVFAEGSQGSFASAADVAQALADLRCYLLVAEADREPMGLLSAYRFPDVIAGGELVYLYDIEVRDDHRRKGAGAALIRSLKECCARDGVKLIWAGTDVNNRAARCTFEASGAVLEGESYAEYEWELSK